MLVPSATTKGRGYAKNHRMLTFTKSIRPKVFTDHPKVGGQNAAEADPPSRTALTDDKADRRKLAARVRNEANPPEQVVFGLKESHPQKQRAP